MDPALLLRRTPAPGEVWLVGAGPGDPGLLTLAGWTVLRHATAVLHDRLGCEEILLHVPRETMLVDAGKRHGGGGMTQEEINHRLAELAREGHCVVRLKGGDPFVFGRGWEEVEYLRAAGVPCHAVPGITSAVAGPASFGVPLTHRGSSRGFVVATGHTMEGIPAEESAAALLTHVYLMAVKNLEKITGALLAQGLLPDTPAVLISQASTYQQRSLRATLGTIAARATEEAIPAPAILVAGETAGLAEDPADPSDWILVTASRIPGWFDRAFPGARPLWRPLQRPVFREFVPAELGDAAALVRRSGLLAFHGSHPVRGLLALWGAAGEDLRSLSPRLAAIGAEAARALREAGLRPDIEISAPSMEEVGEQLAPAAAGSIVTAPCGEGTGRSLLGLLPQLGAREVHELPLFHQEPLAPPEPSWEHIRRVLFSSPAGVRRFPQAWPAAPLDSLTAFCLGPATCKAAHAAGFPHVEDVAPLVFP